MKAFYVPYVSDYLKNRNDFFGKQQFAVLPNSSFNELNAFDGSTVHEFETAIDLLKIDTVTLPTPMVYNLSLWNQMS